MFTQILNAHSEVVTSLTFSPHVRSEGGLLCSTSGDDTAALWDLRAGSGNSCRIAHLTGHHVGPLNHALFHPDNDYSLLTASDDRSIGCWDLRRPDKVVGKISGFLDGVNKMLWLPVTSSGCGSGSTQSGWNVASACDDGHVYVHALVLPGESDTAPSGVVATPGFGGVALVPQVGALVDKFRVSTSTVNDMVLAPHNPSILITASEDCALRSWTLRQSQHFNNTSAGLMEDRLLASLDEFENPVNHIAVVPPGLIGSGVTESSPSVSTDTGAAAGSPNNNKESRGGEEEQDGDEEETAGGATVHHTTAASESAGTGCWLLAACSECVFGVDFAVRSGAFGSGARTFVGHRDYVRGLEFTKEGTLLTVSDDSTAVEWDLSTTDPIRQVKLHEGMVMSSALSPSRTLMATGTDRGEIRVWQLPFQTERMAGTQ